MNLEKRLLERSQNACEICGAKGDLKVYEVQPGRGGDAEDCALLCITCEQQIEDPASANANHWRCLNDSMWSEVPAIKVLSWRMLHELRSEGWPQDLLDMFYLDDELLAWAKEGVEDENAVKHLDSNGAILQAGDTVILIKDLNVKGANFTAKRGTAVRRIALVTDNPEHIEGKINGQQIVILTQYVKKAK